MKENIRPIYSELQGYLTEAPPIGEHGNGTTSDNTLWQQFNGTIEELNQISEKDFNKFKVTGIQNGQFGNRFIKISEYRQKLGGLISRLHGEFFSDEQPPFSGMPSTVITQTQNQTQSVSMILEIQERVLSQITKYADGTKEKGFLEKLKASLPSVKSAVDVLGSALKIGADLGLDPATIHKLLGL
jgi:hypothetical protein